VATCPTDALEYGERTELLQKAHARIAAHPDRYINHVYGEFENGGTTYLIISHAPFRELGLPDLPETPVNEVSENMMKMTIPFAVGWGAVLTGVAAGVAMRNRHKQAEKGSTEETKAEVDK